MESAETERRRIAMITREEALKALSAAWPEGLTAKEVYFAARPPVTDEDRAVSGSAYASKAIDGLIKEGLVGRAHEKAGRSAIYRTSGKPLTPAGEAGLGVREVSHGEDAPALEEWLQTALAAPAAADPDALTKDLPVTAVGLLRASRPSSDGADRIAAALLRKLQAPKPGSRAEVVKVKAAEGIAWARAAGIDDLTMAAEIVSSTGMDARPEEIVHLVVGMPGSSRQAAR
ncbi:hypothetical protein AX289_22320 [Methylorubrum populi]|nr:hypothetical protein AX289_22320 [Methylorubrum populi]